MCGANWSEPRWWRSGCKLLGQRLAEGNPDEAEKSLARVFELDPQNKQAQELKQQAAVEKVERQRRLRLTEGMREAESCGRN